MRKEQMYEILQTEQEFLRECFNTNLSSYMFMEDKLYLIGNEEIEGKMLRIFQIHYYNKYATKDEKLLYEIFTNEINVENVENLEELIKKLSKYELLRSYKVAVIAKLIGCYKKSISKFVKKYFVDVKCIEEASKENLKQIFENDRKLCETIFKMYVSNIPKEEKIYPVEKNEIFGYIIRYLEHYEINKIDPKKIDNLKRKISSCVFNVKIKELKNYAELEEAIKYPVANHQIMYFLEMYLNNYASKIEKRNYNDLLVKKRLFLSMPIKDREKEIGDIKKYYELFINLLKTKTTDETTKVLDLFGLPKEVMEVYRKIDELSEKLLLISKNSISILQEKINIYDQMKKIQNARPTVKYEKTDDEVKKEQIKILKVEQFVLSEIQSGNLYGKETKDQDAFYLKEQMLKAVDSEVYKLLLEKRNEREKEEINETKQIIVKILLGIENGVFENDGIRPYDAIDIIEEFNIPFIEIKNRLHKTNDSEAIKKIMKILDFKNNIYSFETKTELNTTTSFLIDGEVIEITREEKEKIIKYLELKKALFSPIFHQMIQRIKNKKIKNLKKIRK